MTGAPTIRPTITSSAKPPTAKEMKILADIADRHHERIIKYIKLGTTIGVSLLFAVPCIYVVFGGTQDQSEIKWAQTTLAFILGFWLRKS